MLTSIFIHAATCVGNRYAYSFFSSSMISAVSYLEPENTSSFHRIGYISNEVGKDLTQFAAIAVNIVTIGKIVDDFYAGLFELWFIRG